MLELFQVISYYEELLEHSHRTYVSRYVKGWNFEGRIMLLRLIKTFLFFVCLFG